MEYIKSGENSESVIHTAAGVSGFEKKPQKNVWDFMSGIWCMPSQWDDVFACTMSLFACIQTMMQNRVAASLTARKF